MKLVSVSQMRELERQADARGLSYAAMMENAGLRLAEVIHQRFYQRQAAAVLGLVGSGNNGGDTLIALKHLMEWGWETTAYLVKERETEDPIVDGLLKHGGRIFSAKDDDDFRILTRLVADADLLLDGILGTGIKLPLKGEIKKSLKVISSLKNLPPIVAVDCPSGVDCDSGRTAGECLPACLTVCMAAIKQGLLEQPALGLVGELAAVDIGLPANLVAWQGAGVEIMDANQASRLLPARPMDAHKGTFGTCLIAAGSINYCGAALLAAEAAYRVGVGLVRVAVPSAIYDTLAGKLPEATWLILPDTQGVLNGDGAKIIRNNLKNVSAMLIGPGWGLENDTLEFLEKLLEPQPSLKKAPFGFENDKNRSKEGIEQQLPAMVIDADGLKLLARIPHWEKKISKRSVLTPHHGEMAILTGKGIKEIQANRQEIACEYSKKWGHVVVLKGALTVVAEPGGRCTIIPFATPALATAGTGDVLAGMITGLIAQGLEPYSAAICAAWMHAKAGLEAGRLMGNTASVMAGDVVRAIQNVLTQIGGKNH